MDRALSVVCVFTMMSAAHTQYSFYHQRRSQEAYPPLTNAYQNPQSTNLHYTIPPVFDHLSTRYPEARTNRIERQDTSGIQESPRVDNGTYKILNRLEINKRGGHRTNLLAILLKELQATIGALEESVLDDNDRVVFPGPTSSSRRTKLIIPEKCRKQGYCENVPNHPVKLVENAIVELGDRVNFLNKDVLPEGDAFSISHRFSDFDTNVDVSLCQSSTRILYPEALPDKDDTWYTVVNLKDKPVQGFLAEICETPELPCNNLMKWNENYSSACVQKHVFRVMEAIDKDGVQKQVALKLPSCCTCVARPITRN